MLGFVISGMIYKFEHQKREKQNYKLLAISEISEIPDMKEGKNSWCGPNIFCPQGGN